MKVVAIIPALNEEEAIGSVVRGLPEAVTRVIVIDNGSSDHTALRAREAGATVVYQPERGYGAACMAGVEVKPDADIYIFLDGDGSDPPGEAARLLETLEATSADLVLGLRRGSVEPGSMLWHQRLGNVWLGWLIRRLSGQAVYDLPSFKAIRAPVLHELALRERKHGWTAELITRCACRGLAIESVSTGYRRRIGSSKVSGSLKGSLLAAYRLNSAVLRVWLSEHSARRSGHRVDSVS
jgi:glycosyltransferase involved in cell wall biosynthesis